jgi:putative oxidoreductase
LERAGYPAWVLIYTLSAEFGGASLITLGIYMRWASRYALPMMIGATLFWVPRNGFYFTGANWELPFIWSLMLLVQALLGDGAFAHASRVGASALARGRLTPPANRVDP